MKLLTATVSLFVLATCLAADLPKPAEPQKEHTWLKQLSGEWVTDSECVMEPGKPPMKCQFNETTKLLGNLWSVAEFKCDMDGTPFAGQMTLGYDPAKKKFIGTWVCSMEPNMFTYEGTLDGNTLTLNTEGPNPATGKMTKMRDVIEVKSADEKVTKSYMQGDDGKWVSFVTMSAKRKK